MRTHRWAIADRFAWSEAEVQLTPAVAEVCAGFTATLRRPQDRERRFVHGDLSGNVFRDERGRPVVLDISPYLRPARWAAAIVVADAVLWYDADPAIARAFASAPRDHDLLVRALLFRLVAEQLGGSLDRAMLESYERLRILLR